MTPSSPSLFLLVGFLWHCVIRECLIIDNRLDHFADVRAQEPIDRNAHKLRSIQDRAVTLSSHKFLNVQDECFGL